MGGTKGNDVYAECFSTRQVLLEDCPAEHIVTSDDGCVQTCSLKKEDKAGCGLQLDYDGYVTLDLEGKQCTSVGTHTISMCSGACVSETVVTGQVPSKRCNCCAATATEKVKVLFDCEGTRKEHEIEVPTECSCDQTKCEQKSVAEILQEEADRKAAEEAARQEAARIAAEQEAARIAAELEAARKAAEA